MSSEVVFVSNTSFLARDTGDEFSFGLDEHGAVGALAWSGIELPRVPLP